MNTFLKFASIPLGLFVVFFGLPRLIASLVNSHTDAGLIATVMLACGIVGYLASLFHRLTTTHTKDTTNED